MYYHEVFQPFTLPIQLVTHTKYIRNKNILRHWHQAVELNYLIRGHAKFSISGQEIEANSDQLVIINSNEIHAVQPMFFPDSLILTFLIPYDFLTKEIKNFDSYWFVNSTDQTKIKRDLKDYYHHSLMNSSSKNLLLKSDTYQLLYDLITDCAIDKKMVSNMPVLPILDKLSKIISYVETHSQEALTLNQLASQAHLSPGYFSRVFKKQMGQSVMEYVNLVRLKNAFELLTNTKYNLQVISDRVGFPNVKSFRKIFKKIYGETPKQYRKSHKLT
ncbi:AraC family transcriptional regulator [Companilactobacillus sp. HBUAS59544]|uniref:AraC family transcriptional regulator n=1 Tax=Companilactobacillus sp. HBUAS59544 TaxID=3109363 RepID=UPI002FF3CE28